MQKQEEILLTREEIAYISEKAKHSLMMHNPGIIAQFTKHWWDISHISPVKKLLFVQGHRFTGLEHINVRHRFYTNEHSSVSGGFMITSRFSPDSGTLFDYSQLAEFLYDEKYKRNDRNKRPEIFDLYQAKVDFKERSEFCLVVYKNSTIIHTLFPIEKNRKTKKYRKQDFFIEYSDPGFIRGFIPYTDANDKVRFGIGIRLVISEEKESWAGLIYGDENKLIATIEFGEMNIQYKWGPEKRIEALNFADLSKYEDLILNTIKKENL